MTAADLAQRLEARSNGSGWTARCPAHEDRRASLSIGEGEDGRVLVHCHAGCATDAVLATLGLEARELFAEAHETTRRIVATYDYTSESGELLYQVVRREPKDFRQRRPDGSGWTWRLGAVRRVLYRLPRVRAAAEAGRIVYVAEGERDVESLEALGLTATCNAGGAGKWRDDYAESLRGVRGVVVLPDKDDAGRAHADAVARSLHAASIPVKVVEPPGLPLKGDVSDWLAAGGTRGQLVELTKAAPRWEPTAAPGPEPEAPGEGEPARRLVVTRACDIHAEPVTWLWEDRIPSAMFSLMAGREGTGKSTALLERAARLTRGDLPGAQHGTPRSVVVAAAEDSWAHTIRPRLEAAGADLARVLRVTVEVLDVGACEVSVPDDLEGLGAVIAERDVALVILDPLTSRLRVDLDSHKDAEVRQALEPLARLADESGAAVVGIIHVNKSTTRDPLTAVMGSRGFVATARAVLFAAQDPQDRSNRVLSLVKCNVGPDDTGGVESQSYRIEPAEIETRSGPAQTARIVWTGRAERGAREIHAAGDGEDAEAASARAEAEDFLRELLADGPVSVTEIRAAAKREQIARRTLDRAKARLQVVSERDGFGPGSVCRWRLPDRHRTPTSPIGRQPTGLASYGESWRPMGGQPPGDPAPTAPSGLGSAPEAPCREPGQDDDDPEPSTAAPARRIEL